MTTSNSRLNSVVKNTIFAGLGTISNLILGLLFAGLTIRYLGTGRAGYLLTLQAFIALNTLLGGFGLSTPLIRRISELYAHNELNAAQIVIGSVSTVNIVVGSVLGLLIVVFFPQIYTLSRLDNAYRTDAFWGTVMVVGTFLIGQATSSWQSVYQATQRYDLITALSTVFGVLSGLIGITVLTFSPTISSIAGVGLALSIVRIICDTYFIRRLLDGVPGLTWAWAELQPMFKFGGWTFLTSLGGFFFTNVDRLIITSFLGSAALPYYAIPQRLFMQVHAALAGQTQFIFPMFAAYGDDAIVQIRRVEDRLRWFIALLSAVIYTVLGFMGPIILNVIVGPDFSRFATFPLILVCVQGFFQAQNIVPYYNSYSIGKGAPNATTQLLNGLIMNLLAILLIPHFGYLGASIAQLSVIIFVIAHIIWVSIEINNTYSWNWCQAYVSPLLMVIIWVTIVMGVSMLSTFNIIYYSLTVMFGGLMGLLSVFAIEQYILADKGRLATLQQALRVSTQHLVKFIPSNLVGARK